jgi:diguanylate cyclase (GGDEF)-like protein
VVPAAPLARFVRLAAFALLVVRPAWALDPHRRIDEYSLASWSDPLPQNTVHTIWQTRDGFLWIGTYEGAARFDGVRFSVFDKHNMPALKNQGVLDLFEDSHGALWIATAGGGAVRMSAQNTTRFDSSTGLAGDFVTSIREDRQGRIWIATTHGLSRISGRRIERVDEAGSAPRRIFADSSGGIWIGFEDGSVSHYGSGGVVRYGPESGLPRHTILAIAQDRGGTLWVGTEGSGLYLLEGARFVPRRCPAVPEDSIVRALIIDREGALWIGTEGRGVVRYAGGAFTALTDQQGLPSNIVRSLFEDREGTLWIGTNGGGLAALRDLKFVSYSKENGLSHDNVRCVIEDRPGSIWIGTDGGGIDHLENGTVRAITTREGLPNDYVRALYSDGRGDLWIGTTGAGLVRMRDGRFDRFTMRDGLPSDVVYSIHGDRSGALWIGTNRGLVRLKDGQFTVFTRRDGLTDTNVNAILEDRRGVLWVGTGQGISRWHDGRFEAITTREGLPANGVLSFHEDTDGSIWIGTTGGIARVRDNRIRAYTRRDGLIDDVAFAILDDARGSLWMSSNKGIQRVAKRDFDALDRGAITMLHPVAFGRADGMKAAQCNGVSQPAGLRASDGRLWFATIRGVATIDPARLRTNPVPPPVAIESVSIDGVPAPATGLLAIAPGKDRLEIEYAGLSFVAPEKISFRYRLEGWEERWNNVDSRRTASYTNIPPGRYLFHVIAANDDGVWNDRGASMTIEMRPFWYQTRAFRFAALAATLALALLLHRWRLRKIEQHRHELSQLVEQRTQELARANFELERLSSIDGLTGVANRRVFDARLATEWHRAFRAGVPLSLLMIDIDHFKQLNDAIGHLAGDDCLRQVARAIAGEFRRAEDLVARYGGEEFAVILAGMNREQAMENAERVRLSVERLELRHPASPLAPFITISVGVSTLVPNAKDKPVHLVAVADNALYRAKTGGRNRAIA